MQDPDLAALDPIFWLHHSNIDRLWEVWMACDPAHTNLTSAYWLTGVPFDFHDATGTRISMRTNDVLSLASPLLDYTYEDASCPVPFRVAPSGPSPVLSAAPLGGFGATMAANPLELVGATLSAVRLGNQVEHVSLPTPVTPHAFRLAAGMRSISPMATARQLVDHVTLKLENVTSTDIAPTYDVFLNVPNGENPNDHDDRFVGRIAMFGIKQASDPSGPHGGGGQNFALDVTELYHHLADRGEIDPAKLRVSFVPVASVVASQQVTVGRISLYFS